MMRSTEHSRMRNLKENKHHPIGEPLFVIVERLSLDSLNGGDKRKDEPNQITGKGTKDQER
jgi:hypothetical protein